jgi:hypothetical protein
MSVPDKIQVVYDWGDWGMGICHSIISEDADPNHRHDLDVLLAEVPSMQPYCMGESSKNIPKAARSLRENSSSDTMRIRRQSEHPSNRT